MISIQTNVDSLNAQRNLNINHSFQSKTIQQLTSGYRINSSADDAAGLAIANSYRSKVAELNQGVSNANDGVSQLQIIDGGLSNISTILDRMKTLATQSASATFTGNRSVLNQEYSGLLSEINRQATNVNLNAGGTFNNSLSVYIGGANTAANANINIDLSGTSNAVDSTSLGLASTSVAGGGTGISGNTLSLTGSGATFVKGTSPTGDQTFTFNLADATTGAAKTIQATVKATANGSSLSQVLTSLNSQLSSYGISAGTDTNGALQFGGSTAFTVSDNATVVPPSGGSVIATSTGSNLLTNQTTAAGNGVAENVSNYLVDGKSSYVPPAAGGSETLNFTSSSGAAISVNLTNATSGPSAGDTLAHALSSINAATSSYGIYAVANAAGTGITFQSANTFSVNSSSNSGSTAATAPTVGATAASFTGNTTSLSSVPNALANGSQVFTFNVAKSDGTSSSVGVTLSGGTAGLTAAQVVTKLNAAIAAQSTTNPELGTITASLDSNNKLVFSGGASNTAFSVDAAAATVTPGSPTGTTTVGVVNGTGAADNITNHSAAYQYTLNPSSTQTLVLGDSTGSAGGSVTLTVAANSTLQSAVKQINTQLAAASSTSKAVLGSDGTSISFQNATSNLTVGGPGAAIAAASTTTTTNALLTTNTVDLSGAGPFLATGNQVLTFHTINSAGASQTSSVTVLGGGGLANQAAVLTAVNTAIAAAITGGATGLNGITAVATAGHLLAFTGTSDFTVSAAAPTAGTDNIATTGAYGANTNDHVSADQSWTTNTALNFTLNDGTPTAISLTAAQNNGTVSAAVTALNSQLIKANSSVRALVDAAGTGISFQSTNNFTVGGTASNASTTTLAGFGASNTDAVQSGNFLTGGAQTFTFNVAKSDGTTSAVNVTLNGGATGITSGNVVSSLNAAIASQSATNPELGTITASLDANNHLVFNGGASNTAFTVTSVAPVSTTAGAVPVAIAGAGTAENTSDHVVDSAYSVSSGPQTIALKDGTGTSGEVNLTIAANSNINSAISQINTALTTAGSSTKAVLSADGTQISFQNATNALSLGGTDANTVSGPTFTVSSGSAADLSQSGALLKNSATQVFTFNIANSATGASINQAITLTGTAGGLTGAAAVAQLNASLQTQSATTGESGLANIVAGLDASNHITFTDKSGITTAFTVNVAAPSGGNGVFAASTGTLDNTGISYQNTAFVANAALTNFHIVDHAGTDVNINVGATTAGVNDTVDHLVTYINAQLQANATPSLVTAVKSSDGTHVSFQAAASFTANAVGSTNTNVAPTFTTGGTAADLSITGDYLQNSTQAFTFNVKGANGANDPVTLTLQGGTGLTGAAVVTSLQNLINSNVAAHPGLANIVVGQNATTHALTFTTASGSTSPFTVSSAAVAGSGTGVLGTGTATAENTNLHTYDQTYASGAQSYVINDASIGATTVSLTSAQNTNVTAAVKAINQQLSAAGSSVTALVAADGTNISFQSTSNFRVGGTASNPTTTKPASIATNAVSIQSGPFLANNATQAFTFNVVDPASKSSTAYTININGGANGLTSQAAVLAAANTALATAVAGVPASGNTPAVAAAPGLAGITAAVDSTGHLTFTGAAGQAFTVQAGPASAGTTGLTSNSTAVSSDNSALYAIDQKFTASAVATGQIFTVGSKTATVTISAGATIDQQITQTNNQLSAGGITNVFAVKSGDGTSISYQSAAAFSIGSPDASGVFNGSTAAGTTTNAAVVPTASESGLTNAEGAINAVNAAIKALGLVQGTIGAGENKLQYAINLAQSQISNFSSAESQIRDTDVAQQAANLTKSQVLTQTSIAAMAQANSEPQSVLKLLQ